MDIWKKKNKEKKKRLKTSVLVRNNQPARQCQALEKKNLKNN